MQRHRFSYCICLSIPGCRDHIPRRRTCCIRWGTRQPITVRDKDFGVVRLRANGKFAFRVKDSVKLLDELVGTQGKYTTEDVTSYLKDLIVSRLTDLLASQQT